MVGEFCVICRIGSFYLLWGIHGFLDFIMYAIGADFASFII